MSLLVIRGVSKMFGGLAVLKSVSLDVDQGQFRLLIGPNGAGKSTLLKMIGGLLRPDTGEILFASHRVESAPPQARHASGIRLIWQTPNLIDELSAEENVLLSYCGAVGIIRSAALHQYSDRAKNAVKTALAGVRLERRANVQAAKLAHAERKLLELGCGIVGQPRLLLVDEPTAGLSEREAQTVTDVLLSLKGSVAALIVAHDMLFTRRLDAPVTFLHMGTVVREGSMDTLVADPLVRAAYFGADA